MKNNNPPNGHSHVNNQLVQSIRQREAQLRDALNRIAQMSLAIKSISTLAAMYKVHVQSLVKLVEDGMTEDYDVMTKTVGDANKLLAAGHMEPVNEILRLRAELEKANALTGAQANMIKQLEKECRDLGRKLGDKA